MAALMEKLHSRFLKNVSSFSFIAAFSNFSFLLYLLCPATWTSIPGRTALGEFYITAILRCFWPLKASSIRGINPSARFFGEKFDGFDGFFFVIWVLSLTPGFLLF